MKRSVLIVDGDPFVAGLYARTFEHSKWSVEVAETVEEALGVLKECVVDIVVVDVETVKEGDQFAKELIVSDIDQKVVVLVSLAKHEVAETYLSKGAFAYLLKGHFVASEMCQKLERLLEE